MVEKIKSKLVTGIIIGLIIGVFLGAITGYIATNSFHRNGSQSKGNFQLDKSTQDSVISFFNSTSDLNEINSYCEQNRIYCSYYCMSINHEHEICSRIQPGELGRK